MSTDTLLALVTVLLPLAAAWALWKAMPGALRWLALVPLALLALHAEFLAAFMSCDAAPDRPFANCALPATEGVFNSMRGLLYGNLTILLLVCPGLLIVAGIAALIRREGHES